MFAILEEVLEIDIVKMYVGLIDSWKKIDSMRGVKPAFRWGSYVLSTYFRFARHVILTIHNL